MLVVPVSGDKITTKDDSSPRVVSSYTNLKDEPAVYLTAGSSTERYVYFSDIVEINGVRVEYDADSKVFDALGPLTRKYNLPQPKDTIKVKLMDVPYKDEVEPVEVVSIKLHSQRHGISKGLQACGAKSCFTLADILDIDRKSWSEKFDADKFRKFYFDYLPSNIKNKG